MLHRANVIFKGLNAPCRCLKGGFFKAPGCVSASPASCCGSEGQAAAPSGVEPRKEVEGPAACPGMYALCREQCVRHTRWGLKRLLDVGGRATYRRCETPQGGGADALELEVGPASLTGVGTELSSPIGNLPPGAQSSPANCASPVYMVCGSMLSA